MYLVRKMKADESIDQNNKRKTTLFNIHEIYEYFNRLTD